MWTTLALDADGSIRGQDGARLRFRDPAEVARAAAHAHERPVLETRLRTGARVALAFEPGMVHLLSLPARDDLDTERLAKIISHDVRAPLRAIEAYSTFLSEDAGALPEPAEEDLGRLRAATARLRAQLDALVEFLRAPQSPPGGTASLHAVASRLAARFTPEFEKRGGTIRVEEGDAVVPVAAGPLEEHLARLVDNVLVHTPAPATPHARLVVKRDIDGHAVFEVADDGPGLPPEERARVIELFRRRGARRVGDDRAGAGLAIVKRAAEAWGGDLTLDAAPEGGLLARVELPTAESARRAAA